MKYKCEVMGCENEAEFWDAMDNKMCADCVEREIREEGTPEEDFETLDMSVFEKERKVSDDNRNDPYDRY